MRALSANRSWKGQRVKSTAYKLFEKQAAYFIGYEHNPPEGELFVKYIFYVKNYGNSDTDNMIKPLQDVLVKSGHLKDDRYIKGFYGQKERVKDIDDERIEIYIVPFADRAGII